MRSRTQEKGPQKDKEGEGSHLLCEDETKAQAYDERCRIRAVRSVSVPCFDS